MRALRMLPWGLLLSFAAFDLAIAHHSYTKFDMAKSVTIEGTAREFQWTNPHVWIQLTTKDPATGKEVEWSIESDSPNMLKRRGWTRHTVQPGDKIVAVIHPSKVQVDSRSGALETMTVNGTRIGAVALKNGEGAGQ